MNRKSFNNVIYELNETTIKKEKIKIFEDLLYFRNSDEKENFIMQNRNLFSDYFLDNEPIYYRSELYPALERLSEEDINIINNIFRTILNGEKVIASKQNRKVLMKYFKIYRSSEINNIYFFYNNLYNILNINISCEKVNLLNLGITDTNYYISKLFPQERRNELKMLGVYKIYDLEEIKLNTIEIMNLKKYVEDLKRYKVNDKLIESIINVNERNILLRYYELKTYKNLCKELLVSETKARTIVYTIYKKLVNFFDSVDGIRALNILFSNHPDYITKYDIYKMFDRYGEIIIRLFSNKLVYNVMYDEKIDGFVCK